MIAIDGKTLRRSFQKKGAKAPIHMISAFAARQRLVLGQIKVAEKSNEIVAIIGPRMDWPVPTSISSSSNAASKRSSW
jgi:hypothetical protein